MKFKQIRFKNFLSYGNVWTVIDFDLHSIINIIGPNGKGKSVFIDAIHYALTGKAFRDISVTQLPNTINKKDCIVELDVERGDIAVTIKRGINPKIFDIVINGVSQNEANKSSDHQKTLERILRFNSKTLKFTIIMSSMNYSPFLKMNAADKRAFIDDMLDIAEFTELHAFSKKKYSILGTKIYDIDHEIDTLQKNLSLIKEMNDKVVANSDEQISMIEEKIKKLKDDIKNLQKNKEEDNEQLKDVEKKINRADTKLKELIQTIVEKYQKLFDIQEDEYTSAIKLLNDKRKVDGDVINDGYYEKLKKFENQKDQIDQKLKKMKSKLEEMEKEYYEKSKILTSDLAVIETDIKIQEKQKRFLFENSECPTCKREIDDVFREEAGTDIDNEISSLNIKKAEIEAKRKELENLSQNIDNLKKTIEEFETKKEEFIKNVTNFKKNHDDAISNMVKEHEKAYNEALNDNKSKKAEIEKKQNNEIIKLREKHSDAISSTKELRSQLKTNIGNYTNNIKDKESVIKDYNEQITSLKNPEVIEIKDPTPIMGELIEKQKIFDELKERKRIFDIALKLLADKGFKAFIIRKYIPILNKYVNEYLQLLEANYRLKFDENLNETIVERGYEKLSYDSFSSGEKARCDLALLFGFLELSKKKNSIDTNLLILDEVADNSLDVNGVYGVLNIISNLKNKGYTTYVISHRQETRNEFDITLEASKDVFSTLEKVEQ